MFNVKGLKKEDLVVVATELGLNVESEHKVVDLKGLIEKSSQYEKDFEFVKEFLNTTVTERTEWEKHDAKILKAEKEHWKAKQKTTHGIIVRENETRTYESLVRNGENTGWE